MVTTRKFICRICYRSALGALGDSQACLNTFTLKDETEMHCQESRIVTL
jgi:hypothetical protein